MPIVFGLQALSEAAKKIAKIDEQGGFEGPDRALGNARYGIQKVVFGFYVIPERTVHHGNVIEAGDQISVIPPGLQAVQGPQEEPERARIVACLGVVRADLFAAPEASCLYPKESAKAKARRLRLKYFGCPSFEPK